MEAYKTYVLAVGYVSLLYSMADVRDGGPGGDRVTSHR